MQQTAGVWRGPPNRCRVATLYTGPRARRSTNACAAIPTTAGRRPGQAAAADSFPCMLFVPGWFGSVRRRAGRLQRRQSEALARGWGGRLYLCQRVGLPTRRRRRPCPRWQEPSASAEPAPCAPTVKWRRQLHRQPFLPVHCVSEKTQRVFPAARGAHPDHAHLHRDGGRAGGWTAVESATARQPASRGQRRRQLP